jgi:PncC family amidohydrolase
MDGEPWEVIVGRLLEQQGLQLAIAESCTGGLVGHRLTNVPGSSSYFLGGVIAYSNALKMDLLGVRAETLEKYGAVSEQAVLEMAQGVRSRLQADLGLSVSGIAGPDGGTAEKPVGLVWFGLSAAQNESATAFQFRGNRMAIKDQAAAEALELLVDFIGNLPKEKEREQEEFIETSRTAPMQGMDPQGESGMDAIEVMARFDSSGKAIPLKFSWRDRDYLVESTGRRWEDDRGQHVLVMIPGGRVFELLYSPDDYRWYLRRSGENRMKV